MQGTIRSYDEKALEVVKSKIKLITENTAIAMGCVAHVELIETYPAVVNHKNETQHVIRIAKANFGEEKVKGDGLPLTASEDFSYYLKERPGCFYILGIKRAGMKYSLHTSYFDYNDSMIASGALLFVRIVEDRLQTTIL